MSLPVVHSEAEPRNEENALKAGSFVYLPTPAQGGQSLTMTVRGSDSSRHPSLVPGSFVCSVQIRFRELRTREHDLIIDSDGKQPRVAGAL